MHSDPEKKSVGIIYKHHNMPAKREANTLKEWFIKRGIQVYSEEMEAKEFQYQHSEEDSTIPKTVNWLVVLGGDGTLLGAARRIGKHGVPILGVNLGGLGFLTGVPFEDLYPVIEIMLQDRIKLKPGSCLKQR
jgi:NAD+ kinase